MGQSPKHEGAFGGERFVTWLRWRETKANTSGRINTPVAAWGRYNVAAR